ncbi:hypothetical protein ABPG75_000897 [Micractinium tetrahymenae]
MTAEVAALVGTPAAAAAAPAGSSGTKAAAPASAVADAIAAMAAAVQRGDFAAAEEAGSAAPVNLSLPRASLRCQRPLSAGAQAAVYSAELYPARLVACPSHAPPHAQHPAGSGGLPVAIKRAVIRESADLDRFRREAALLAALRHHPHMARLLGARLLPPDYCLVLQLEADNAEAALYEAGWRPSYAALLRLGAQLASAVAALHALGHVHRDIKPGNVLLDEPRCHARLADLGLAAPAAELAAREAGQGKPTGGFHKQRMVGTLQYMAPEVLLGSAPQSFASDVFALAVTLNELAAGIVPYSDCTRDNPLAHTVLEMGYGRQELAAAVAAEGLRPTLPPGTPPALRALLQACWAAEPAARPSAAQLECALADLEAEAEAAEAEAACLSPQASLLPPPAAVPTPQLADAAGCRPAKAGAEAAAARRVRVCTDVDMAEAEEGGPEGMPSPADVLSSPGSSECSSPAHGSSPPPPASSLPAWLAAGAAAGGAAGATFASAQHAGGSATDAAAAVHVGSYLTPGRRDNMEDTIAVLPDAFQVAAAGAPACTVLGVFDGHRGTAAAEYLAAGLHAHLAARLPGSASGAELLAGALADADAAFRAQQDAEWAARVGRMGAAAAGPRPAPGATATLLLLYPGAPAHQGQQQQQHMMLAVANLGDSRALLCRDGRAVVLTRDHTADLPDERARVAAAGGACSMRAGSWRVGEAGLQVTRSIGDADLKAQGVSAEAETAELALSPADSFLIVATDGLWDKISNDEAVALVHDTVKHPAMCAQRLVTEALARGGADNVACLVALLSTGGATAERVYHAGRLKYGGGSARHAATALSADELRDT